MGSFCTGLTFLISASSLYFDPISNFQMNDILALIFAVIGLAIWSAKAVILFINEE
jgi:hypothetical protein